MKIFVAHSSNFDYRKELYDVLKTSDLYNAYDFFLPHDGEVKNTKEEIKNSDVVLVYVSEASTGQGD